MNPLAKYCFSTLCATAVIAVPLVFAAKPPPPPTLINVTSTVHDQDTSGNTLLFRGDDLNGTQATYTNSGNVKTTVGDPGGWNMDLFNQVARTVCLSFSTVDGSKPVPPNGCYFANVEIYSHCHDLSDNEIGFLTIPAGTTEYSCLFGFDFTAGRTKYKLEMGQSLQTSPPVSPPGGATGLTAVTCNASDGSNCDSWTITNNPDTSPIANLYYFGNKGLVYVGQYYLTYRIGVTNP